MKKLSILIALLFCGCATQSQVQKLQQSQNEAEKKIDSMIIGEMIVNKQLDLVMEREVRKDCPIQVCGKTIRLKGTSQFECEHIVVALQFVMENTRNDIDICVGNSESL